MYSMKPNFLNLFMKWLTLGRVVPMISASVAWLIDVVIGCGPPSLPKFASSRSVRASRFSLELKSWSTRSSSTPAVARQQMLHEHLAERPARPGARRTISVLATRTTSLSVIALAVARAQRLADQAALAEEIAGAQHADHGLLALLGGDDDLDPALLDVEHRIRWAGLPEDDGIAGTQRLGAAVSRRSRGRPCGSKAAWTFLAMQAPSVPTA